MTGSHRISARPRARSLAANRPSRRSAPELDRRLQWDIEHRFADSRLRSLDTQLADLVQTPAPGLSREASLLQREAGVNQPAWLDRLADVGRPPLPGHDTGAGIDLGP
jgi:hypothetical protein